MFFMIWVKVFHHHSRWFHDLLHFDVFFSFYFLFLRIACELLSIELV